MSDARAGRPWRPRMVVLAFRLTMAVVIALFARRTYEKVAIAWARSSGTLYVRHHRRTGHDRSPGPGPGRPRHRRSPILAAHPGRHRYHGLTAPHTRAAPAPAEQGHPRRGGRHHRVELVRSALSAVTEAVSRPELQRVSPCAVTGIAWPAALCSCGAGPSGRCTGSRRGLGERPRPAGSRERRPTDAASGYVDDSVFSLMCARPSAVTVVTPAPESPRTGAGNQETRMVQCACPTTGGPSQTQVPGMPCGPRPSPIAPQPARVRTHWRGPSSSPRSFWRMPGTSWADSPHAAARPATHTTLTSCRLGGCLAVAAAARSAARQHAAPSPRPCAG